jgi:nicotinate-nucleotide adenylyltransferase
MARLIGVFGGTFDPPHIGHLLLAEMGHATFCDEMDKVLWVVAADPPHKPASPISPIAARLEMVEAAIADNPHFELSRTDVDRPGPHFSADMLALLKGQFRAASFAFLIGADSLAELPTWHEPARLIEECRYLAVMRRPGVEPDLPSLEACLPGLRDKLRFFDAPQVAVSGSEIRKRLRQGLTCRYIVPSAVLEIIIQRGLYQ